MTNVCLLNDSFPPVIDGVANAVLNYANVIEEHFGHAIVAVPDYPGYTDRFPFEVIRYRSLDTTKQFGYRMGLPLELEHISRYIRKDIDIIHCHCPISSMFLARSLRQALEKPVVLTYHTKFDIDIKNAIDSKILQEAAKNALVDNICYADEVWAVSKGAGENLKSLGYGGNYVVMRNGVDFEKGKSPEEKIRETMEKHGVTYEQPVFLFVGRMMWYKGLKIILDALRAYKEKGKDFRMLFVGNGQDKAEIVSYAKELSLDDRCVFVPAVSDREELKVYYSLADLFLFPSTFDTNGIVVSEASASGLASVLIKDSCAAEEVTDRVNAFLIEENSASLCSLLEEIGEDRNYLREIGNNAMRDLYFSWKDSVAAAVKRYQTVMDSFHYHRPEPIEDPLIEHWFALQGDLASALDKAHELNENISNRIQDRLDRWL